MTTHHLSAENGHAFWDKTHPAQLEIASGDTVILECRDATDGQITPQTVAADLPFIDRSRTHALNGPIYVKDAQPGDALAIEVLELSHHGWGWSSHAPNFGLLSDEFDYPFLQHWRLDGEFCYLRNSDLVAIPFEPFCGVMGVAPAADGRFKTGPPGAFGGNMDIRGLTVGSTLYLPVFNPGALFSVGDCHAAQGDGEVCGTGIESPMTVTLRFRTVSGKAPQEPQFTTPSPLTKADSKGYFCTTGHGPDLFTNSQNAVRYMIDWLEVEHGMSRSQAYVLCSAAADLKISEVVDKPNWIVSCYMPLSIFRS